MIDSPKKRCERVFVYGTLRKGQRYRYLIDPFIVKDTLATIRGEMYEYAGDLGADGSFPYVKRGEGTVHGEVLSFRDFSLALAVMDEIEDYPQLYTREIVDVICTGGERTQAIAYFMNEGREAPGKKIESGDWLLREQK